jgi:hypothetical protein
MVGVALVGSGVADKAEAVVSVSCAGTRNIVINELNTFNTAFSELFVTSSALAVKDSGMSFSRSINGATPTLVTVGAGSGLANPGTGANEADNASTTYSSPTWIRYTSANVLIDKNNNNQIVLFDSTGKVLDMVTLSKTGSCTYTGTYWSNPGSSCNTCVTNVGSSTKDYFRLPDGSTTYSNSGSGNSAGGAGGSPGTSNLGDTGITVPAGSNGFYDYCVDSVAAACTSVTANVNLVFQSTSLQPMCSSPFIIPKNGTAISITGNLGVTAGSGTLSSSAMTWTGTTSGNTTAVAKALTISSVTGDSGGNLSFVVTDSVLSGISTVTTASTACTTAGVFDAYEASYSAANAIAGTAKIKTHVASDTGLCVNGGACTIKIGSFNAGKTALNTSFTGPVKVEVVDASSGTCAGYTSLGTIASLTLDSSGETTVTLPAVSNSYANARIRISYPATGTATAQSCSTDNFAIRPASFASISAQDSTWVAAGSVNTLDNVTFTATLPIHKAGRPFSLNATAFNVSSTKTTNYSGTPSVTTAACVGAACTATLGTLTLGSSFASGVLTSTTATYDNVGAFSLALNDMTFANVDASDSTTDERYINSTAINVGRFVPDAFALSPNIPSFAPACLAGNFTYLGQSFGYATAPVITVTAQSYASPTPATATAYTGSLWRLGTSGTGTYSAASGTLSPTSGTSAISDSGGGVGTISFSGNTLTFTRASTEVKPFDAEIALAVTVADTDGVAYASNPYTFGTATSGNGISFSTGKTMRYGRLRLANAFGSERLPLSIPMTMEYFNSSGVWATHIDDSCTQLLTTASGSPPMPAATLAYSPAPNAGNSTASACYGVCTSATVANTFGQATDYAGTVLISNPIGSMVANVSIPSYPAKSPDNTTFAAGLLSLTMGAPLSGTAYLSGAFDLTLTSPPWLYYNGANPVARVSFGIYNQLGNAKKIIYRREVR